MKYFLVLLVQQQQQHYYNITDWWALLTAYNNDQHQTVDLDTDITQLMMTKHSVEEEYFTATVHISELRVWMTSDSWLHARDHGQGAVGCWWRASESSSVCYHSPGVKGWASLAYTDFRHIASGHNNHQLILCCSILLWFIQWLLIKKK